MAKNRLKLYEITSFVKGVHFNSSPEVDYVAAKDTHAARRNFKKENELEGKLVITSVKEVKVPGYIIRLEKVVS